MGRCAFMRLMIIMICNQLAVVIIILWRMERGAATSAAREKEAASRDAEAFDDLLAQVGVCSLNKRLWQCTHVYCI